MPPPSKIIKGQELPDSMPERPRPAARPGVIEAEVYDATQRAKEIVAAAERQAAQIVEKAQLEREATLADAREQGRQLGLAQVSEQLLLARKQAGDMLAAAEPEIVKLALTVAERLIGHVLETDPDVVIAITAQAIENVRQQRELILRVNPEDAKILKEKRKQLMDLLGRTKDIAVREDAEIPRGGCIIETENGTVDAQLKTQLQMLEHALLGEKKS